jgi:RNA polymerase sigma factor (TIGR02999 family)
MTANAAKIWLSNASHLSLPLLGRGTFTVTESVPDAASTHQQHRADRPLRQWGLAMVPDDAEPIPDGEQPAPPQPAAAERVQGDVTLILSRIEQGEPQAAEQLLPLVYEELRRLAAAKMAQEKPGQTLQPTALVHEAYLRLVRAEETQHWNSRGHFFCAAAEAMRRILVENARRKRDEKHGGKMHQVELTDVQLGVDTPPDALLLVADTLDQLAASDPQAAQLVKLHCFAGLSIEQAAELLGISARTGYRDWSYARAWLYRTLERGRPDPVH